MNLDCYFCADTKILLSGEECACVTRACKCHNCLYRNAEHEQMINEQVKLIEKKLAKQKEVYRKHSYKQWEQPELPFNEHRQGATGAEGYDPRYKDVVNKKRTKPDPATVEAELQLEEKLWAE